MKLVSGERLDYNQPKVNCAGCYHKVGKVCTHHGAHILTSPHIPTDCNHWKSKEHEGL